MSLRVKGGQKMKCKNLPLIVASNFPIQLVFEKYEDRSVIEARFLEVHIRHPLPLDSFEIESESLL